MYCLSVTKVQVPAGSPQSVINSLPLIKSGTIMVTGAVRCGKSTKKPTGHAYNSVWVLLSQIPD